jgi:O-antigen biosynthesis protein
VGRTDARADGGADARRLIDWTGERCVPWAPDTAMLYEHFHRYLWAGLLLAGRTVLDLGSGEGFGAAILAESAASVIGVDVDAAAVQHATANYSRANLAFAHASATDLTRFGEGSFTGITAFEMIEHVRDHERVIAEVAHVLSDEGILAISTPDRETYAKASGKVNPFHERELSLAELRELLAARFEHVSLWGQRTITGSYLSALDPLEAPPPVPTGDFVVRASPGAGLRLVREATPIFIVALASNSALPAAAASSTLADYGMELVHETARAHAVAVAERDRLLAEAHEQLTRSNHVIDEKREEVLAIGRRLSSVETQLLQTGDRLWETRKQLDAAQTTLAKIEQSVSWQLLQRARRALYGLIGERSRLGRGFGRLLQLISRLLSSPGGRDSS